MARPLKKKPGTIYAKRGVLYIGFRRPNEKRYEYQSTGLPDSPENRRRAQALLAKVQIHAEAAGALTDATGPAKGAPLTVAVWAARWLQMRRDQGIASVRDEEAHLREHVLPIIGGELLNDIRPRRLVEVFLTIRRKPVRRGSSGTLAPKTVYNVYGTLHAMFRDAKLEDLLLGDSPCILTKRQLGEKVDKDSEWRPTARFSREEVALLIGDGRIPPDRRVFYALQGLAALRHGEAAGLRWRHFQPEHEPLGRLVVATSYDKGRTKTKQLRSMPVCRRPPDSVEI